MGILSWIVLGLVAGWLAGQFMKGGGYGLLGDLAGVENAIATIGIAVLLTLPLCLALRPAIAVSRPVSV